MRLRTLLALAFLAEAVLTAAAGVICAALAGWPGRWPGLALPLAASAGVGAAGALLLASWVAGVVRRPLAGIRAAAQSGAAGNLRAADPGSFAESFEATAAYNTLVTHVARHLAALELDKSTLESTLTQMSDALLILDPTGALAMVNPSAERIFGVSAALALGRHPIEVFHHFELDALVRRVEHERAPVRSEIEVPYPDHRVLRVQANPVVGPRGAFLGSVIVAQDITDLRRTDRIRQEFVANVSHELRTPLASLRALAETLRDGAAVDSEAGPRFLAHMIAELDRLTLLVNDLLDLSAIESGSAPLTMGPVSAADVVNDVLAKFHLVAERRRITLRAEGLAGLPPVWGDETRLAQALANLVDNAVKYTDDGGTVTVAGQDRGDLVALSVTDTGTGIPAEHLSRIFERFYRVDRSRSRTLGGTGLGLSIVKHIATSHGGRVDVQSTEGRGSCFTLFLPRAQAGSAVRP
jgi:two-component system, OmpR family, phosphate regulon sensor histidine kinase PhoR